MSPVAFVPVKSPFLSSSSSSPSCPASDSSEAGLLLLRAQVKEALGMARLPKDLTTAYYFLHCYRASHRQRDTTAIDNNLARRWERDWEQVPCTTVLQNKLDLTNPKVYRPYFDAFIHFTNDCWNSLSGRMRTGEWNDAAHELFGRKWVDVVIPLDLLRKFFFATEDYPAIDRIRTAIDNNLALPAVAKWCRPFYHSTKLSPHRRYHYLQDLKTEAKRILFRGCINMDIVSCFQSLWWHELGGKAYSECTPNGWLLDPARKEKLHKKIAEDFGLDDPVDIKKMRQQLFSNYKNNHFISSGHVWYDTIRLKVVSDCERFACEVMGWEYPTSCHRVFTYLEGVVIERVRSVGDEALLMHDGVIYWRVDVEKLREAALPHLVKVEQW